MSKNENKVSFKELLSFRDKAQKITAENKSEYQKDPRTFSRIETHKFLHTSRSPVLRICEELNIDPSKFKTSHGIDFILSIDEIYKIRKKLQTARASALYASHEHKRPKTEPSRIITVINNKGGVAKTVSTLAMATGLAIEDHRELKILIIDMDGQSTLSKYYPAYASRATIGDLLTLSDDEITHERVKGSISKTTIPNLDILPSDQADRDIETVFHKAMLEKKKGSPYQKLSAVIEKVRDEYDVIIIDTPPSLGFASINAIYASDAIIVPLNASSNDLDATMNFLTYLPDIYSELRDLGHQGMHFFKILVTNYDPNSSSQQDIFNQLQSEFRGNIYQNALIKSEAIHLAAAENKSVFEISSSQYDINKKRTHKKAVENIKLVLEEILEDINSSWGVKPKIIK